MANILVYTKETTTQKQKKEKTYLRLEKIGYLSKTWEQGEFPDFLSCIKIKGRFKC